MIVTWVLNALALYITAQFVPGIHVADAMAALLAAVVIGFVNTVIKPLLLFLTLPINLMTLGLFTFVINAVVLWLAAQVVPGFSVDSLTWALLAAVVLAFVSTILSRLSKDLKLS